MLVAENEAVKKIFGNKPARFSISAKDLEELVTTVLQNCLLLRSKLEDESKNVASLKRGLSTEECVRKRKIQGEEDTAEDANIDEEDVKKEDLANGKDSEPKSQYKQVGGEWVVDRCIWAGRRKKAAMVAEESVVGREAAITRLVMEEQAKLAEPEVVFTCHLFTTVGQSWVALQKIHSRKKSFESMVGWFNPYLTDLVQRLMKDIHQNPKTE